MHEFFGTQLSLHALQADSLPSEPPRDLLDPLEKELATQSSILAWEIPRLEESGQLESLGSQKVGHN